MCTQYGIPLDSRANFTKTDWLTWVAAMGNSDQVFVQYSTCTTDTHILHLYNFLQFKVIVNAVYKFANETPDRFPFTDW